MLGLFLLLRCFFVLGFLGGGIYFRRLTLMLFGKELGFCGYESCKKGLWCYFGDDTSHIGMFFMLVHMMLDVFE